MARNVHQVSPLSIDMYTVDCPLETKPRKERHPGRRWFDFVAYGRSVKDALCGDHGGEAQRVLFDLKLSLLLRHML